MPTLIARVAALGACSVLLLLAWHDLRRRRLPNSLVAAVGAFYLVFALVRPTNGIVHLAFGLAALLLTMLLTARGVMGGGDAKLTAVLMCWTGPGLCLPMLMIVTQTGLLLALLGLGARAGLRRRPRRELRAVLRCVTVGRGVPYGVALAVGGIWTIVAQSV